MISTFNHRLLLIEKALTNNAAVLAGLQMLELNSMCESAQSGCDDSDQQEVDRLKDWIVRLRSQVARTERRIERLRARIARHDAQLSDIRSRIVWSSGGCAVVRLHSRWGARSDQQVNTSRRPSGNDKRPSLLQVPRLQNLTNEPGRSTVTGGSWSARNAIRPNAATPQLSRSFTCLLPVKRQ